MRKVRVSGAFPSERLKEEKEVVPSKVLKHLLNLDKKEPHQKLKKENTNIKLTGADIPEEARAWREDLHHLLAQEISPDAFERLTQRLLRESGFVEVEVTGKTGDGGIGRKIKRINVISV